MNQTPKPNTPQDVYKDGILYSTIIDYFFIEKGSSVLKAGWHPIQRFNFNHPIMVAEKDQTLREQAKILERKNVDWNHVDNTYMTI